MIHSVLHRLHNRHLGLLLIRVALGVVFIAHGYQKLGSMEQTLGFFGTLGIPVLLTYAVIWTEIIGGALLILGFLVRYAGIALSIVMIVAIALVHLGKGFFVSGGGYEFALVLLLSSLALVFTGAGRYSLSGLLRHRLICHDCEVGKVAEQS